MILGVGTDLANIERIAGVLERHGDRFRNRVETVSNVCLEGAKRPQITQYKGSPSTRKTVREQQHDDFKKKKIDQMVPRSVKTRPV